MSEPFLAIDWGTTNRRIYRIGSDGDIEETFRDDQGVTKFQQEAFAAEIKGIRAKFGDLPILCAGMIGSSYGWIEVPYVSCPVTVDILARGVVWKEAMGVGIVPGVSVHGQMRADVMRGEEVQLLGAIDAGMAPPDSMLCQPGTHCKWAWMKSGQLDDFVTTITGEIYSLLKQFSLLKPQLGAEVCLDESFQAGLKSAAQNDVLANLFSVRADAVSGAHRLGKSSSYVSGLLIGHDVNSRVRPGDLVHILSDPDLGQLYNAAIQFAGGKTVLLDSHEAFVAGIKKIWSKII